MPGRKHQKVFHLVRVSTPVLPMALCAHAAAPDPQVERQIAVEWQGGHREGRIVLTDGMLESVTMAPSDGAAQSDGHFVCTSPGPCRLQLSLAGSPARYDGIPTIVEVETGTNPFSFFLRDVDSRYPITIPAYRVSVTDASDSRSYDQIAETIWSRGLLSELQQLQRAPEENFADAADHTRQVAVETWLGLSRDFRVFAVDSKLGWIEPRLHAYKVLLPETGGQPLRFAFQMGRGTGPADHIVRHLEDGALPILHGTLQDKDIRYELTTFVTLEKSPLTAAKLRGTDFLVGEGYGFTDDPVHPAPEGVRPWTEEIRRRFASVLPEEMNQPEETALMMQVNITNTAAVPGYAFIRNPVPVTAPGRNFDGATGFDVADTGKIFSISTLDGKPLASEDVTLLLKPGETASIQVYLSHRPIPRDRAAALASAPFAERHRECREFWQQKLAAGAQITLPERRIDEMIRAGLLHLDLVLYGREPSATLAAMTGVYTPIGTESSPIIQFIDSMGWHDVARRALQFFLDKQLGSGMMVNYGDYMLETAGALYTMGEHYRYTHDDDWVRQIEPKLLKSTDFIVRWRRRNLRSELRGCGYGLMPGKVADPQDFLRSFMFNGYSYAALERVAEMLAKVDPAQSQRYTAEAAAFREDIRTAFFEALARSPVIPLGNGAWCPTAPMWAEGRGAPALLADSEAPIGLTLLKESTTGPEWLIVQGVIDPFSQAADFLVNSQEELVTAQSAALGQPYYSQHPLIHLLRREPKQFLAAYYSTMAAMADRETYTFYEGYGGGPHKTHEEAQFLMQTRYMLYLERGETLELLPGVPRSYFENGKSIRLTNAASYFGPVSLHVQSNIAESRIEATIDCSSDRRPQRVELRVPHPDGLKATWVEGGQYNADLECVIIQPFSGHAEVTVAFGPRPESLKQTEDKWGSRR